MSTNEILEQFGIIRRQINRLGIIYLKEISLGPKQTMLVRFVHKHNLCTMTDISIGVASDKASVTRMVNSLVRIKYLELTHSKDDHRVIFVSLGPKAEKIIPEIERIYSLLSNDFVGALTAKERNMFLEILKKTEPHLQRTIKESL